MTPTTPGQNSVTQTLAEDILTRVESLLMEAEQSEKPLEVDPMRGSLFELFVTAEAAGFLVDDAEQDMTADGIARKLSEQWGLTEATRESVEQQTQLPQEHLSKMRMLWSFMRMWMEWTYAWQRWNEFHES